MMLEGANYLISTTSLDSPSLFTAKSTFVALDNILEEIAHSRLPRKAPLIIILDCCRTELMTGRKGSQYAGIETKNSNCDRSNTCIIYATSGNQEAQDGSKDDHGVFTKLLLKYMDSDDSIDTAFDNIQRDLQKHFSGEQVCTLKLLARIL